MTTLSTSPHNQPVDAATQWRALHATKASHQIYKARQAGYTLFEIMMVVAIIAILAGISIFAIGNVFGDVDRTQAESHINQMEQALVLYKASPRNRRQFPTTEQGLEALVPKYLEELPTDPWGEPYKYLSPGRDGRAYDLWSLGADKQVGGEEENADITSWTVPTP